MQSSPNQAVGQLLFGTIRNKIVLPFLFLTMIVAMGGTFIVMRLVAANVQDRVTTQLIDSAQAATDSAVRLEEQQLELLRLVVFSEGVPEALASGDTASLANTLRAIGANQDIYMLFGTNNEGMVIADVVREAPAQYTMNRLQGQSFGTLPMVRPVLLGEQDDFGDKFAGFVQIDDELILLTTAPVFSESGERVGSVGVGSTMTESLTLIKQEVLVDLTLYQSDGSATVSTLSLADPEALAITPALFSAVLMNPEEESRLDELDVAGRTYQTVFVPLKIRDSTLGVMGVSLPPTIVTTVISTNRTGLSVVFSLVAGLVVVIGYLVAQNLSKPIEKLTETAEAVQHGDLTQLSGVRTPDEIGFLGATFDTMMRQLKRQTDELEEAYLLQEREATFLTSILSSTADGIVVIAPDGDVIRLNPRAVDLIRKDRDVWGQTLSALVSEFQSEHGQSVARTRVQTGSLWFEALASPVRTPGGDQLGYVVALRDITDQVLSERMRTAFISQISHELRTPLAAIKGFADLTRQIAADEQAEEFLGHVLANVQTLDELVESILNVTALIRGDLSLELAEADLTAIVGQAVEAHVQLAMDKDITVDVPVMPPLPVYADGDKLAWALGEVVKNAFQYTPPEGAFSVQQSTDGVVYTLTFSDTGVGIAEAEQPRIFEQFYRGFPEASDGSYLETRGAGLGLFIAETIIAAHDGTIAVESVQGQGSTFTITLPRAHHSG